MIIDCDHFETINDRYGTSQAMVRSARLHNT
jgi:GGDEF domain-containing protein